MKPMNLLVIMSDEHTRRAMGAYGHAIVKTPNLDALALRGTRFASAYTNCPICVPSRAAFQTGQYTHRNRYWDNAIAYDGRVPGWGHRLQDAGVTVESIGKLHYRREDDPLGFDDKHIPMYIKDGVGSLTGSIRDPLPLLDPGFRDKPGFAAMAGPGTSDYNKYDARVSELTCDWLRAANDAKGSDAPWVLFSSFLAPHYPLTVPEPFYSLYDPADIPDPKLDPALGHALHPWTEVLADRQPHANGLDPDKTRRAIAAYYGLCSYVDDLIGRVLDALAETGLDQTTRVIYTSDHGENAGVRGLWGKSVMYEESTGIPMIVAGPDIATGAVCETPVSLVDIYPTTLAATGLLAQEAEALLPGRSLFDIAAAADDPERPVFSEYHASCSPSGAFMLRRGRYKYIHYVGYEPELFDLFEDPEELRNLASEPSHATILADCEAALRVIVDPDIADRQAKDDQNALIISRGGREKVLADETGAGSYTRVPDTVAKDL
jgi:choline-sulfatase